MKTAHVEIRSQHAKGIWPSSGPNTYVAVQVVPDGVNRLIYLNHKVAKSRGIKIIYCGEGYGNRRETTRSALGAAIAEANKIADEINNQ